MEEIFGTIIVLGVPAWIVMAMASPRLALFFAIPERQTRLNGFSYPFCFASTLLAFITVYMRQTELDVMAWLFVALFFACFVWYTLYLRGAAKGIPLPRILSGRK